MGARSPDRPATKVQSAKAGSAAASAWDMKSGALKGENLAARSVRSSSSKLAMATAVASAANKGAARHKLRVAADGRLLIPAELRAQMDLDPEGHVSVWVEDGVLNVQSSAVGIRKARAIIRQHLQPGSDEVGDFLRERRASWGEE